MLRSLPLGDLDFDPEIDRTFHRRLRERRVNIPNPGTMEGIRNGNDLNPDADRDGNNLHPAADQANNQLQQVVADRNRPMWEFFMPTVERVAPSIAWPAIQANNFELKPALIQMVQVNQYGGGVSEDPHDHLTNFLQICATTKSNGVSDDAIRLRLFPFSLRDKAKSWLNSLPAHSLTSWDQVAWKFLEQFFPPNKTIQLRNEIFSFRQYEGETLYEVWQRFKELLRRCPHHGISLHDVIRIFYTSLGDQLKTMIDAVAGGSLMKKSAPDAYDLIEEMATNTFNWHSERNRPRQAAALYQTDTVSQLQSQVATLTAQLSKMQSGMDALPCDAASIGFPGSTSGESFNPSKEEVSYMNKLDKGTGNYNPYSNTYNPGWKDHPNFSWSNQNAQRQALPPGFQRPHMPLYQQMPSSSSPQSQPEKKSNLEELMTQFIQSSEARHRNNEASIHNLEKQIGQLAKMISERPSGSLPSNTEPNPREHVNAISLRSGKELLLRSEKELESEKNMVFEENKKEPEKEENGGFVEKEKVESGKEPEQEKDNSHSVEKELTEPEQRAPQVLKEYVPRIPYPARLIQSKDKEQYGNFLNIFKQLHINIPFLEAIFQMPKYAKFLKELLFKKRKLEDVATIEMGANCSSIIQNTLPPKLKDPGSFTISCMVGDISADKALADLGASINVMPYSFFKKLGLSELKSTRMVLQLADRSMKCPMGIIEDVLVKVGKFIYPVDFVVLDMGEEEEVPLILGRPFLATARALIDVEGGQLVLRVEDEEMTVKIAAAISEQVVSENREVVEQITSSIHDPHLESIIEPPDTNHQLRSNEKMSCKPSSLKSKGKEKKAQAANSTAMLGSSQLWSIMCDHCGKWVKKPNVAAVEGFELKEESSHNSQFDPP